MDLSNDQPIDACGYIAADVIVRLREAALAAGDSWHTSPLPDYSQEHWIHRGNAVLGREDEDRILDSDDVNRLVRHYSGLSQNPQAREEWWGGPIALDHFLQGLGEAVRDFVECSSTHLWRAWAVKLSLMPVKVLTR